MEHAKDCTCGYCMRGELLEKFGIYICDLDVSTLILFKEQEKFHFPSLPDNHKDPEGASSDTCVTA